MSEKSRSAHGDNNDRMPVPIGAGSSQTPIASTSAGDLPGVERLRLKADAARWAAERSRLLAGGADYEIEVRPEDQSTVARGKAAGCHLWMLDPRCPRPSSPGQFDLIAAWYDTLAGAVALANNVLGSADATKVELEPVLHSLAEAQSGLRESVAECAGYRDADQQLVFDWLRRVAAERGMFIPKGMARHNPADPSQWAAVAGRIHAAGLEWAATRERRRTRRRLLGNLRHKAGVLSSKAGAVAEAWAGLAEVVEELVGTGLPPSSPELRHVLLPLVDAVPSQDDLPPGFRRVVREVEQYRKGCTVSGQSETVPVPAVVEAARLLKGKTVVLIGGDLRPEAKAALERAFGLKELIWIGTSKHTSYKAFTPSVSRPDVAAVLLAIRWVSHSYGEVRAVCEQYRKPLVRLTGGYNPNQVAAAVVQQASRRLAGSGTNGSE